MQNTGVRKAVIKFKKLLKRAKRRRGWGVLKQRSDLLNRQVSLAKLPPSNENHSFPGIENGKVPQKGEVHGDYVTLDVEAHSDTNWTLEMHSEDVPLMTKKK